MKVSTGGDYLKVDEVKKGDVVKFLNEGEIETSTKYRYQNADGTEGDFKKSLVIGVEYKGETKKLRINASSKRALIDAFGDDTNDWIMKSASIIVLPTPNGQNKMILLEPITLEDAKKEAQEAWDNA